MSFSFFFPLFFRYSTNNTNIKMRSYLQQLDRFIIFFRGKKKEETKEYICVFFFVTNQEENKGKNEELKNKQTNED